MVNVQSVKNTASALLDLVTKIKLAEKEHTSREGIILLRDAYLDVREENLTLREKNIALQDKLSRVRAEFETLKAEIANENAYHFETGIAWKKDTHGNPRPPALCANCLRSGERVHLTYGDPAQSLVKCPKCGANFIPRWAAALDKYQ